MAWRNACFIAVVMRQAFCAQPWMGLWPGRGTEHLRKKRRNRRAEQSQVAPNSQARSSLGGQRIEGVEDSVTGGAGDRGTGVKAGESGRKPFIRVPENREGSHLHFQAADGPLGHREPLGSGRGGARPRRELLAGRATSK